MEKVLKQYDKLLTFKKNLNGSVDILRQSPFDVRKRHVLFTIANQHIGSVKWVVQKLISMDTTRHDLVGDSMRNNWKIRNKKEDRGIHRDMAEFLLSGGSTFVN